MIHAQISAIHWIVLKELKIEEILLEEGYEMKKNKNIQKYLQLPCPIQILKHERKTNRNKIRIFEVHGLNRIQYKIT